MSRSQTSDESTDSTVRYPNVIPESSRHGFYHKDRYDSGPVRDGHKLVLDGDDNIGVIHPPECQTRDYRELVCPWDYACEGLVDSWTEMYCSGDPCPLERLLPHGTEVEVTWQIESGASWTDYGWEYDTQFSWWFGDEEHLQ